MSRNVLLVIVALFCGVLGTSFALAQQIEPPDYFVVLRDVGISEDGTEGFVTFAISNIGGPSDRVASANLVNLSTGEIIASQQVRPIVRQNEVIEVTLTFDLGDFAPGIQLLRVEVGIGELNDANESNNYLPISLNIPRAEGEQTQETTPEPTAAPVLEEESPPDETTAGGGFDFEALLRRLGIYRENPTLSAVVVGVAAALSFAIVILLYIVLIILRLLFRRTPTFGAWQPPYANVPLYDPNTIAGRRQLWQQQAQNNLVDAACAERAVHVRKLLLGMDGRNLSGWRVMAIRLSQYDTYGRVARSQTLASGKLVRKANRMARKAGRGQERAAARIARGIAKELARSFRKKINKRNAMLPIALDIRLQGVHGEVRILFELFQCFNGTWTPIDRWEPEMTISGKTIYESMTYTLHGQLADEKLRAFHKRMRGNLAALLLNAVKLRANPLATAQQAQITAVPKQSLPPAAPSQPPTAQIEHTVDEY